MAVGRVKGRSASATARAPPARSSLRRVGIIAAAVAVLIAVSGILAAARP